MFPWDNPTTLDVVGGSSHTHSHHAQYHRRMSVANMQRHSSSKRHCGAEALGAVHTQDSPAMPCMLVGWSSPEVNSHLFLLWHVHSSAQRFQFLYTLISIICLSIFIDGNHSHGCWYYLVVLVSISQIISEGENLPCEYCLFVYLL